MYGRIQMKCMLHTKGCTWTGSIVDLNAHMNGCVHNVDAILKRAEVAEAKVKALEAQVEAQRKKAAAEMEGRLKWNNIDAALILHTEASVDIILNIQLEWRP